MKITRNFYSLAEAASMLESSVEDLIYEAKHERISLYALPRGISVEACVVVKVYPSTIEEDAIRNELKNSSVNDSPSAIGDDEIDEVIKEYYDEYEAFPDHLAKDFLEPEGLLMLFADDIGLFQHNEKPVSLEEFNTSNDRYNLIRVTNNPIIINDRNSELFVMSNDLGRLKKAKLNIESTRRIENLQITIAKMAMDKYGYNPEDKKSSVPAIISKLIEPHCEGSPETVRKWLSEGASFIVKSKKPS